MGLALAPRRDGKVLTPEMFETLPEAERERIQRELEEVQGKLEEVVQKVPQWEREHREALRELNRNTTGAAIALMMDELRAGYCDFPDVAQHLDAVEHDIKENADDFLSPPQLPQGMPMPSPVEEAMSEARFRRYQVNVIVDNGGQHGAPVIYEDNPTHQTLVGRVEYMARFGTLVTDFNLLTPGALHRANGGYLMLDAQRLLAGNFGWASLKRALNAGEIRTETLEQLLSMASTVSLQPEPIPLDVKVVLLGPPLLYYLLSGADEDFKELFKIAADFDDRVERTPETTLLYARFIAVWCAGKSSCRSTAAPWRASSNGPRGSLATPIGYPPGCAKSSIFCRRPTSWRAVPARPRSRQQRCNWRSMRSSGAVTGFIADCRRRSAARPSASRPTAKWSARSTGCR